MVVRDIIASILSAFPAERNLQSWRRRSRDDLLQFFWIGVPLTRLKVVLLRRARR